MAIHKIDDPFLNLVSDPQYVKDVWGGTYDVDKLLAGDPWDVVALYPCAMFQWLHQVREQTIGEVFTAMGEQLPKWSLVMRTGIDDFVDQDTKDILASNIAKDPRLAMTVYETQEGLPASEAAALLAGIPERLHGKIKTRDQRIAYRQAQRDGLKAARRAKLEAAQEKTRKKPKKKPPTDEA